MQDQTVIPDIDVPPIKAKLKSNYNKDDNGYDEMDMRPNVSYFNINSVNKDNNSFLTTIYNSERESNGKLSPISNAIILNNKILSNEKTVEISNNGNERNNLYSSSLNNCNEQEIKLIDGLRISPTNPFYDVFLNTNTFNKSSEVYNKSHFFDLSDISDTILDDYDENSLLELGSD